MYNRNLLLELFDDILANETHITKIKAAIAEIEKENNKIFEKEQEDKPTQDVTNPQEDFDCDNSLITWPDSLPASPQTTTHDGSFINIPNIDRLDSEIESDLSSIQDVPPSTLVTIYPKKKSTQPTASNNKHEDKKKEKLK